MDQLSLATFATFNERQTKLIFVLPEKLVIYDFDREDIRMQAQARKKSENPIAGSANRITVSEFKFRAGPMCP